MVQFIQLRHWGMECAKSKKNMEVIQLFVRRKRSNHLRKSENSEKKVNKWRLFYQNILVLIPDREEGWHMSWTTFESIFCEREHAHTTFASLWFPSLPIKVNSNKGKNWSKKYVNMKQNMAQMLPRNSEKRTLLWSKERAELKNRISSQCYHKCGDCASSSGKIKLT